jgi:putative membrane protein
MSPPPPSGTPAGALRETASRPPEHLPEKDPRVFFAAERTFLAWIRTGLSLMGFGFVVARFGLFLEELSATHPAFRIRSFGFSLGLGTGLIVIGVFVNLSSMVHHRRLIAYLNEGRDFVGRPSLIATLVAVTLALCGVAMAIYLVAMR